MLRIYILTIAFSLFTAAAWAGEDAAPARRDVWSAFAGMDDELQGQTLELRDEMIPAHMSFLAALDKAAGQLDLLTVDDLRLALAWSRVEYLLETSFRLLESSGEYDAFLKTTAALKPIATALPAAEAETDAEDNPPPDRDDGGLAYSDAEGRPLVVVSDGKELALLDAETGEPPEPPDAVFAVPVEEQIEPEHAYIPLIRARAAWLRALALERLGKTAEARAETEGLGLIRDWAVMGPLEGVSDEFSYLGYALEDVYADLDTANASAVAGRATWRPFTSVDPLGRVFPGAMFRGDGARSAAFLALVHADKDGPAVLRFGSTASAVVCVNHVVVNHFRVGGTPDPDQEAVGVWMRRGWNIVLIRTTAAAGEWAFAVRMTQADGSPFPGRTMKVDADSLDAMLEATRAASARSVLERFYSPTQYPEAGGVSVVSKWLDSHPEDARGNFYLASLLVARRMMEGPERFDRELIFRRAMDHSSRDPFFTLMAARSIDSGVEGPDREENLRLVLLRSVADKGSAAALVDIGRLYLDVMRQPRRADEYADMAQTVNPMSLRAGVLDYDVAVDMGWEPVAKALLEKLVNRHPSAAAARLRLGRAALEGGRHRQALTEFHAILAVDACNREALDGAVLALGMLGQTSAAVDLLIAHIGRFPYDFAVRIKLAELYRTLGRDDEAGAVIAAALEMAPDDSAALAIRADILRERSAGAGALAGAAADEHRQEIDLSPVATPPANGWEYLYFQIEDAMETGGAIRRNVSFAVRIYTDRAARMLRHLSLWLDSDLERSRIRRLDIIEPDGSRQHFTPPRNPGEDSALRFYLPPLRPGMAVEAEVEILRESAPFLGEYFGHIAPLAQLAPVRLSRYMLVAPKERRVFFKPVNGAPEAMVVESPDGKTVTRIWEMSNLPAYTPEPHSPGLGDLVPCVQVSSFGDWDEFARWYWRLIGVQYHSPPELRLLANRMAEGGGSPMAKLDRAAVWIARNIGQRPWEYGPYAFRPINARSILSRLSADGKDRTLLLCLLAREYGLEAWPVLSRFRGSQFTPQGSNSLSLPLLDHFNYSLALVHSTMGGDVFMDASNPYRPPAVMPPQLSGSPGIAVSPNGGRKIHIPDGGSAACEWLSEAEMVVDADGSILWEEKVVASGAAAENLRSALPEDGDVNAAWDAFLRSLGGDPSTSAGEFDPIPAEPLRAGWHGRARLRRFAAMEDDRVILAVPPLPAAGNGYPLSLGEIAALGEREHDVLLPYGFKITRRIDIRYPPEWRLVNQSRPFDSANPFGAASLSWGAEPGELTLEFTVEVPGHRVAAKDFPAFRELAVTLERWVRPELVWEKP